MLFIFVSCWVDLWGAWGVAVFWFKSWGIYENVDFVDSFSFSSNHRVGQGGALGAEVGRRLGRSVFRGFLQF